MDKKKIDRLQKWQKGYDEGGYVGSQNPLIESHRATADKLQAEGNIDGANAYRRRADELEEAQRKENAEIAAYNESQRPMREAEEKRLTEIQLKNEERWRRQNEESRKLAEEAAQKREAFEQYMREQEAKIRSYIPPSE